MTKVLTILMCCLALLSCEDDSQKRTAQRRAQHPRPSTVRPSPPADEPAARLVAQRPTEQPTEAEPYIPPIYGRNQNARLGNLTYRIGDAYWLDEIAEPFEKRLPKACFLRIPIYVRNDGMEPTYIPDIQLVDENGALYDSKRIYGSRTIDQFDTHIKLNPQLAEEGVLVFDVPEDHDYVVKIRGKRFGDEYAFVDLR